MTDAPFTLALGTAEPDLVFRSLAELAREICRRRDALPGRPGLLLAIAHVWRGDEGGAAVAVRVTDGALGGKGSLIGYAFMRGAERPSHRLMAAICAIPVAELAA